MHQGNATEQFAAKGSGLALFHRDKRVRLKWHRLRRNRRDPLFSIQTLADGLALGAAMEVDLRITRDGNFAVLHDETLDQETDGIGTVAHHTSTQIGAMHYSDHEADTARNVLFIEDLAFELGSGHPDALLQLDLKDDFSLIRDRGVVRLAECFSGQEGKLIISADSTDLTLAVSECMPGIKRGLEPSFRLLDLWRSGRKNELAGQLVKELAGPIQPHMVYLWWELVLPAKAEGIDLVSICHDHGALVDAWTLNLSHSEADINEAEWERLNSLLDLGVDQITTDEAMAIELAYDRRKGAA